MSANELTGEELRRQLQAQLENLRAAGVEWLPAARGLPAPVIARHETTSPGVAVQLSLLDGVETASSASLEERRQALLALKEEVSRCTRCSELCSTRTQTVFGQGELDIELCFVGEAPGADEDAQGIPFVGAAGQLLNRIIAGCGLKREEVYICNILRCRPPGNRTPLASEVANCRDFLERQIELVRPKFICALGGCAATNLLQTTLSLGKLRGRFHDFKGIPVICTYHPAFLLPHRSPEKKREVWEDMKMLLTRMGRPVPQKNKQG